jgi:hypothetical protein
MIVPMIAALSSTSKGASTSGSSFGGTNSALSVAVGKVGQDILDGPTRWSPAHNCWVGEDGDFMDWLGDCDGRFSGPNALEVYRHECDKEQAGIIPRHYIKPGIFNNHLYEGRKV